MKVAAGMTKIISPLGALVSISLAVSVHAFILGFAGASALPDLDRLMLKFVMPLVLVFWLHTDYRRSRYWPCFAYDLFLLVAWPVTLLHYLVHTRGKRWVGVYLGIWGLFLLPALCIGVAAVVAGLRGLASQ